MIATPRPTVSAWLTHLRDVRWGRLALMGLIAFVVAAVFGITTASAQLTLGPHEARYDVTTDDLVTLDLGPLGTLQIDSPLPLTLGVRVTLEEIPADVRSVDAVKTLAALSTDLQSYVQFFNAPRETAVNAAQALAFDALRRTVLALGALLALGLVGRAVIGGPRRAELAAELAPRRRTLIGTGLLALAVVVTSVSSLSPNERRPTGQPASSVFDGTALEGARITGRLAGVVDTYGGQVVEAYRANQEFYAGANKTLVAAWKLRAAGTAARAKAQERFLQYPNDASTPLVLPADPVKPVVMLLISDLHCNVGMASLIRSVAKLSQADLVLDGGDTTIDGTAVEQYCVTTFADAIPDGVPIVVANGNHDSAETAAQERKAGMTVLTGEVVTAAGIKILGDRDPNETRIGVGTALGGEETSTEEAERLAQASCDTTDVDLLLIHDPKVGDAALERGCVPVQFSGHRHVRAGPAPFGLGVRYVNASTAGAAPGEPTVGPLHGTAEMTIFRFDPEARRVIDYQLIEVRPDGSASVGYRVSFPAAVTPPAVDDNGSLGDTSTAR
ncbi:metallophosphoesterase [Pengzhenrongella phosphoraccumulans]|uniref:metallophosphoesterase family protein n=1 Tax=Pengzhenrongella phosphoraccumulans TaxID=3114394 RepID=UPI00388EF3F3